MGWNKSKRLVTDPSIPQSVLVRAFLSLPHQPLLSSTDKHFTNTIVFTQNQVKICSGQALLISSLLMCLAILICIAHVTHTLPYTCTQYNILTNTHTPTHVDISTHGHRYSIHTNKHHRTLLIAHYSRPSTMENKGKSNGLSIKDKKWGILERREGMVLLLKDSIPPSPFAVFLIWVDKFKSPFVSNPGRSLSIHLYFKNWN